jgi:cytosine/adenosine deaminase-related metal-dependent hydrolase
VKRREYIISGSVVYGNEFDWIEGYVSIKQGIIHEIVEEKVDSKGIIIPAFINAHVHTGDSVMKDVKWMNLDELVGPRGLKHRILRETSEEDLVNAMEATVLDMIATGTTTFADFREGGISGAKALRDATKDRPIDVKIFGRPNGGDLDALLKVVDGIGISTTNDFDLEYLSDLVEEVRREDGQIGIHAGEKDRSDIEDAVGLQPDHLVHMCAATKDDLRMVGDENIPVVVSPRSNLVTDVMKAPIREMIEEGITVGVGTDNVMLNSTDMLSESEFISKLFLMDDREVLKMCTMNGAKVLKEDDIGSIEEGKKANMMIINDGSYNMRGVTDPIRGVVRRARPDDISVVIQDGEIVWKR